MEPTSHILSSLAAAGPLALALGIAVAALWRANVAERDRHAAQEDAMRRDHEAERKALTQQLFDTLSKLSRALRREQSGEP